MPDRPDQQWIDHVYGTQPSMLTGLSVNTSSYIPHQPTPKQRLFLSLPHREAFYGGAAGGGKSDALLMGALQYVNIPRFSAIIFRRTLADLELPGALIDRSRTWLSNTDAKFSGSGWTFPSGARLQFGYLDTSRHKYRYQGSEYQYVAFDELTQFQEDDYLYLQSRLRRPRCPEHTEKYNRHCSSCQEFFALSKIPLRMRAASNPGGIGHGWVKKRFQIERDRKAIFNGRPLYMGQLKTTRPHIPAFVQDNPYLDQKEYILSLHHLDPVTRDQLLRGDWGVSADGRFKRSWARHYNVNHENIRLGDVNSRLVYNRSKFTCFSMIDTAATEAEGPGDIDRGASKRSYTVISTFLLSPKYDLLFLDVFRAQIESPEIVKAMKRTYDKHHPQFFGMEYTTMSMHLYRLLQRQGFPLKAFKPRGQDKIARATDSMNRMEEGRIYFPEDQPSWYEETFTEIFTWTGSSSQTDDIIDTMAYACNYVSEMAMGASTETQRNILSLRPEMV